ncbi:MAG: DUF3108 domain-containing protein [Endomicrobium sp.]|uniref:DUF3108 domain-containing protein n=1 Tax=Candidatus Endomicrobiellum cubanum TaxID=3242325 RepID=UPI0028331BD2|nr:DUF3108 domain-containing protein [Endomicrobium sp.]
MLNKAKFLFLFIMCMIGFFAKNLPARQLIPEFEKIDYTLMWNMLPVGEASLELKGFKYINGVKVRYASLNVVTNDFLSSMFSFDAHFESLFEYNAIYSFEFTSKMLQDGKEMYEHVVFEPKEKIYRLSRNGMIKEGKTLKNVKDILAILYCIRTLDLKAGHKYILNLHSQNISVPLAIMVLRKEQLNTVLGQRNCFVIEPLIYENNIIDLGGKMLIWVTADTKKLPIYIKVESNIGIISAKLAFFSDKK